MSVWELINRYRKLLCIHRIFKLFFLQNFIFVEFNLNAFLFKFKFVYFLRNF